MLLLLQRQKEGYVCLNVGSEDQLLVRDIAEIVVAEMGLAGVKFEFSGGARGWRADVPVYSLDTSKIRSLGWRNQKNSRQAVVAAVRSLVSEISEGY
jgi:UDP-glucose 4-epimerase